MKKHHLEIHPADGSYCGRCYRSGVEVVMVDPVITAYLRAGPMAMRAPSLICCWECVRLLHRELDEPAVRLAKLVTE